MTIKATVLIYSHSSCEDVILVCLSRIEKFMPWVKYAVCIDNKVWFKDRFPNFKYDNVYEYDNSTPYGTRLMDVLSQMTDTYIILLHENNIFVDYVQKDRFLNVCKEFNYLNGDQLRLFYAGVSASEKKTDLLYSLINGYFYSTCPTLWKRESLLELVTRFKHLPYKGFEMSNEMQHYTQKELNNYLLKHQDDYKFPGEAHYYSHVFPFTHVTRESKWVNNGSEKDKLLEDIFEEFKIDRTIRGMFIH